MNCLLCYKPLAENETDYHLACMQRTFGAKQIPLIAIDEAKLTDYAKAIITSGVTIAGVQPKLSLWLEENKEQVRFTIINHKSNYIIKPQSSTYKALPENEDVCMHLATAFGIKTAVHALVRLQGGSVAYVTRRFDRENENKIACEDLCQLTETLTEHKYRSSYEKAGKVIRQYSSQAGLDALHYFERIVFSFITGNADMHLKNFMMWQEEEKFMLSPAYDLVSTMLAIKNEPEQMALTVNGKKNKLTRQDFDALATNLQLTSKQYQNVYRSFSKKLAAALWWIENSFLPVDQKEQLIQIVTTRINYLTT